MTRSRTKASRLRSNRRGASGGQSCGRARIGSGASTDSGAGCAGAASEGNAPPLEAGAKAAGSAPWEEGTATGASNEAGGTMASGWACTKGMLTKGSIPRDVRANNRWEGRGAMEKGGDSNPC